MNNNYKHERIYLALLDKILETGERVSNRTSVPSRRLYFQHMEFDLSDNTVPLLTVRRMNWYGIVSELLWMIRGSTNSKELEQRGVYSWRKSSSRRFLDKEGFTHYQEGELGPIYGHQWRRFGSLYISPGRLDVPSSQPVGYGVDQLNELLYKLKQPKPYEDRRMCITSWNPQDMIYCPIPPSHGNFIQAIVSIDNRLSLSVTQRSGDMGVAVPNTMAAYALLLNILASKAKLSVGRLHFTINDCHVYENHVKQCYYMLSRNLYPAPRLAPLPEIESFDRLPRASEFRVINYKSEESLLMEVPQ